MRGNSLFFRTLYLSLIFWSLDLHPAFAQNVIPANPSPPPSTNAVPTTATDPKDLFKQMKFKEVIDLLSPRIEKLTIFELLLLGESYSLTKNSLAAQKIYTAILSKDPKNISAKTLLGAEYINTNKEKEALATLKEALELNPKNERPYLELVRLYEKRKNKYETRLIYQDLVEKVGEKPQYFTRLCELCTLEGIYDLAKNYCQKAIHLSPKEASNYVFLGQALRDTGETSQAQKYLKQAADSFSKSELANMSYGQFLDEQKNFVSSYVYYKRAVLANPKNAKNWISFSAAALEIQKYSESLEGYSRACKLEKSAALAFRQATNTLRVTKQNEWLRKFEQAVDRCP